LKEYKLPGSDQCPAEMIQAEGKTLRPEIHKHINSIWNKKELPDQWKESIIVPIHKKGEETVCNNYCGISLLSTSYKILSNILLSRLGPYTEVIIGDHQRGFRSNRPTTDQIFCIHQILEKKNGITKRQYISQSQASRMTMIQLRVVLYNILIEFEVLRTPMLFIFTLEYAIRKVV
jgi:hypothetical protein